MELDIAAFNSCPSPKDAQALLQALGAADAASAALFAAAGRISVDLLGQVLGHHSEFSQELARCFPCHFSFGGMDVCSALREYLYTFRLPGESAQIERILEGFAAAFFAVNPAAEKPARGWYTTQPLSRGTTCCAHCGASPHDGRDNTTLLTCTGCDAVAFCSRCRKRASACGHAVCGSIGYGRACVAARVAAGTLPPTGGHVSYRDARGAKACALVNVATAEVVWPRGSPFRSADSVMVLCYAIIMLSTNLHSPKVKQKMAMHEFLVQTRAVNDGANFPGDFLAAVYEDIAARELKVMK